MIQRGMPPFWRQADSDERNKGIQMGKSNTAKPLSLGLRAGLVLMFALLVPWVVNSSTRVARAPASLRPIGCASMFILQQEPGISAALRRQLREDMELCPSSEMSEHVVESPALALERHFSQFTWHESSNEREAMQQLEELAASFTWDDESTAEGEKPVPRKGASSSKGEHEGPPASVVVQHGRRLTACSLPTSGDRPVGADCNQGVTVALTGNMKVYGTGGTMYVIDHGGGGRHFTVGAGQTLTVERLRLHNGAVSTSYCSYPYTACGGGIAYMSGSNAVLRLQDAWLSGGRAYYGGGVLAYGGAHIYLNRTSISANSAIVSILVSVFAL